MSTVYLHEMRAAMYAKPGLVPIRLIRSALGAALGVESSNSATTGFGAVLAACIHERTEPMRRPLDTAAPIPQTRDALAKLLIEFGVSILKTVCSPEVLTVYRLAIAESDRAPEIALTLHHSGREANLKTLAELLTKAQERRLVAAGDPTALATRNFAALWGDLLLILLMRVREAPTEREIETRACSATEKLMAWRKRCTNLS